MKRHRTSRIGWVILALLLHVLLGAAAAQEAAPDSLKALAAVAQSPKDGDAWLRLGHACLDAGNPGPGGEGVQEGDALRQEGRRRERVGSGVPEAGRRGARGAGPLPEGAGGKARVCRGADEHRADGHYGLAVSYTEQQRYELALEVADLNSGKAVSRRKMFQLEE